MSVERAGEPPANELLLLEEDPIRPPRRSDDSFTCCGVRIDPLTLEESIEQLFALADDVHGHDVHLCNAYTLSLASTSEEFTGVLNASSLNLADGAPVAWVGRRQGFSELQAPVRGAQLMWDTMRAGVSHNRTHALYGSSRETLDLLAARLEAEIPGVRIVMSEAPPFGPPTLEDDELFVKHVEQSKPDFVWVGLGTPKQDEFSYRMAPSVDAVLIAVGAAFEFGAGTVREAPRWMHGTGLEWLHRLGTEPRRLWKRYLVGNTRFVMRGMRDLRQR